MKKEGTGGVQGTVKPRVLLIGPLPIEADVVGGTKVSFSRLVDCLKARNDFHVEVLNSSRAVGNVSRWVAIWMHLEKFMKLLWRLWRRLPEADIVMWNASPGGAIRAAPLISLVCRIRGCPLVIRIFGGDFDEFYERLSAPWRWLTRHSILGSKLVLFQTKTLVERFQTVGKHVSWLPTSRTMPERSRPLPGKCKRLLYLGQLRPEKGIREILSASAELAAGRQITIAGPAMRGFDTAVFSDFPRVKYVGSVEPDKVAKLIEWHDALIYPSYWAGEGYPGVVIEALQMGLPVIAAKWKAIPELVVDGQNGLLVPARDSKALQEAIQRLFRNPQLFGRLQQGALASGEMFSEGKVTNMLQTQLEQIRVR